MRVKSWKGDSVIIVLNIFMKAKVNQQIYTIILLKQGIG